MRGGAGVRVGEEGPRGEVKSAWGREPWGVSL